MCSKLLKVLCAAVLLFVTALVTASCGNDVTLLNISSDTYVVEAGQKIDIDELRQLFLVQTTDTTDITDTADTTGTVDTMDTVDTTDTAEPAEATDASNGESDETVYWVAGGEVWHTKITCSSLSRSKSVYSGTVEDAMEAGKERVCKRCGG